MPPTGPLPQSNDGPENAEPYYSNEDVAILHDIVVLAQELLPELPERERLPTNALFSAYYDILPRLGLNADHDNRYARVLFKIGGLRGRQTLYEKFESILSKLGIEIEFDHENLEEQGSQLEDSQNSLEAVTFDDTPPQDENQDPQPRQRRNSESTAWDLGVEVDSQLEKRRNSLSVADIKPGIDGRQGILQEVLLAKQAYPDVAGRNADGNEDNIGAWLNLKAEHPRRHRGRSISTHGSMRIRRRSPSIDHAPHPGVINPSIPASDEFKVASEITAVSSSFGNDTTVDSAHLLEPHLSDQEPEDWMQVRASQLLHHHLGSSMKHLFQNWRDKTFQSHEDNVGLNLISERHDRIALLQSAFDSWRQLLLDRRQAVETKRFFAHLERRATRARDLYMMHIAFTHWSNYASEQVQRTAIARRHIVRTRIFNAWRDITAVNELKVRRQVLKKFFAVLKREKLKISTGNTAAIQWYQGNLVEKIYMQWILQMWNVRAIAWWADKTQRRVLFQWIVISHRNWEINRNAEDGRRFQVLRNTWGNWKFKTESWLQQNQEADRFYRVNLLQNSLRKWRRETRIIPAKVTVQAEVSNRLLRDSFGVWLCRTHLERRATATDKMKVTREALTHWRHKTRSHIPSGRIDSRVLSQSLFNWLITSRLLSQKRKAEKEILHLHFTIWLQASRSLQERRWEQENLAQLCMAQKFQSRFLQKFRLQMNFQHQLERAASDFQTPRLLENIVSRWSKQTQHIQELNRWSRQAEFYLVLTKALKKWRAATEFAKREKRKTAYAQVRRICKINLAKGILRKWHGETQHVIDLDVRALDMRQNRNIIIGMNIFDRWRAHTEELAELEPLWRQNVLRRQFVTWRDRSNAILGLETEAILSYEERRQNRVVKKWSLLALQLRAQLNYAADVREKNAKRTFRKMFNYWHQKAMQKRPRKPGGSSNLSGVYIPGGSTARAETWSEFGDENEIDEWVRGLDEVAPLAPIPGYLSTPSKRTERVMAVAARYSTTPKAPLSTPFERHLRAQYSGGHVPPLRKGPGRSTLGMGAEFADIAEDSKSNEREHGQEHGGL